MSSQVLLLSNSPQLVKPPSETAVTLTTISLCLGFATPFVAIRIYTKAFVNKFGLSWADCKHIESDQQRIDSRMLKSIPCRRICRRLSLLRGLCNRHSRLRSRWPGLQYLDR